MRVLSQRADPVPARGQQLFTLLNLSTKSASGNDFLRTAVAREVLGASLRRRNGRSALEWPHRWRIKSGTAVRALQAPATLPRCIEA